MALAAEVQDIRSPELTTFYGTYIGRELFDDELYRKSNRQLRKHTRISEFLQTIEQQLFVDRQLERLRSLSHGWDSYSADAPNTTAFARADKVLQAVRKERLDVTRSEFAVEGWHPRIRLVRLRIADVLADPTHRVHRVGADARQIRAAHSAPLASLGRRHRAWDRMAAGAIAVK